VARQVKLEEKSVCVGEMGESIGKVVEAESKMS